MISEKHEFSTSVKPSITPLTDQELDLVAGGGAYADANARAYANGRYFAETYTNTYTNASSSYWGVSASSSSTSSSTAY